MEKGVVVYLDEKVCPPAPRKKKKKREIGTSSVEQDKPVARSLLDTFEREVVVTDQ